jgi:hypothetical protein
MPWRDIAEFCIGAGLAFALGMPSLVDGIGALRAAIGG